MGFRLKERFFGTGARSEQGRTEEQPVQADRTSAARNSNRVIEVGENFLPDPEQLEKYRPDPSRKPIGSHTIIHAEERFGRRNSTHEAPTETAATVTPVEGRLARPIETPTVTVEQDPAAAAEERQRLLEQSRSDLEYIQNTLKERLAEQSGWLNRIRRIFEVTSEKARNLKMHLQDADNALRLSARTGVSESTLSSIQSTVQRLQQEYGIVTPAQSTRSTEVRPVVRGQNEARIATAVGTRPVAESRPMADLSPEQAQFKLFYDASILLRQAQDNPDRNTSLTQAASGMAQVNKLIERLVVTSRGEKFRIPPAVAELIATVHAKVEPMLQSINPKTDHYTIVTAGKTLGVEFSRFTQFAENYIESIPVPSEIAPAQPGSARQIEQPRKQLNQLFEAMVKSHSNHLQEAIKAQQPERVVRVMQDINRFLSSPDIDINDIPSSAIADIDNQLDWAKGVCANQPALAEQMRNAERAFKLFALKQAKSKANYRER